MPFHNSYTVVSKSTAVASHASRAAQEKKSKKDKIKQSNLKMPKQNKNKIKFYKKIVMLKIWRNDSRN